MQKPAKVNIRGIGYVRKSYKMTEALSTDAL